MEGRAGAGGVVGVRVGEEEAGEAALRVDWEGLGERAGIEGELPVDENRGHPTGRARPAETPQYVPFHGPSIGRSRAQVSPFSRGEHPKGWPLPAATLPEPWSPGLSS